MIIGAHFLERVIPHVKFAVKVQDFMQAAMTEIGPKIQAAQQNIATRAQEVINSAQ